MVKGYQLIDSGNKRKLEQFGAFIFVRPEPKALWKPLLLQKEWAKADAVYQRSDKGGGSWKYMGQVPDDWTMNWQNLTFKIKPTGFKHMGIFPEHEPIWEFVQEKVTQSLSPVHVLNLFGYTGAATLAAASSGAKVTHVDSSKEIITWARENAQLSHLTNKPIRWIPEDVITYCKREIKRGSIYEGIIIDAPAFGRGTKGEVWKIENDLPRLLELCKMLLSPKPLFVILISYATEYPSLVLQQLLQQYIGKGTLVSGELRASGNNTFSIPLAVYSILTSIL